MLTRFVAGECTPEEAVGVRARVATDERVARHVEELQQIWEADREPQATFDEAVAWHRLSRRCGTSHPRRRTAVPPEGEAAEIDPPRVRWGWWPWLRP